MLLCGVYDAVCGCIVVLLKNITVMDCSYNSQRSHGVLEGYTEILTRFCVCGVRMQAVLGAGLVYDNSQVDQPRNMLERKHAFTRSMGEAACTGEAVAVVNKEEL